MRDSGIINPMLNRPISHIDWGSPKDARKAARFIQRKMIQELNLTEPRFRCVQLKLVPSQQEILTDLYRGHYAEYIY